MSQFIVDRTLSSLKSDPVPHPKKKLSPKEEAETTRKEIETEEREGSISAYTEDPHTDLVSIFWVCFVTMQYFLNLTKSPQHFMNTGVW